MLGAEDIPTQGELIGWIENIGGVETERNQALFSTLYLTAARINEIINRLKKQHIEGTIIKGKEFTLFKNIYTEKNRRHPLRILPIPTNLEYELEIFKFVEVFIKSKRPGRLLFEMTATNAWYIISKVIKKYKEISTSNIFMNGCHYLRHVRNTHLKTLYGFDDYWLMRWNGWSSTAPAAVYTHLQFTDMVEQFKPVQEALQ